MPLLHNRSAIGHKTERINFWIFEWVQIFEWMPMIDYDTAKRIERKNENIK